MKLSLGGFSTVTMTDRWFQELRAGRTFDGYTSQAAIAGQYAHVQLKNPAASGKQAIVAQILVTCAVVVDVLITRYDVDCTTDAGALVNYLLGAAAGACHVRTESNVGVLGTQIDSRRVQANTPTVLYPSWGPELSPGTGLALLPGTVNTQLIGMFLVNEV